MSKSDILNIVGDVYVAHVQLNNFADPTCVPGITIPLKQNSSISREKFSYTTEDNNRKTPS